METPQQGNQEESKNTLESEVRKAKKGRKSKVKRPEFNLKIENKDIEIFFN